MDLKMQKRNSWEVKKMKNYGSLFDTDNGSFPLMHYKI